MLLTPPGPIFGESLVSADISILYCPCAYVVQYKMFITTQHNPLRRHTTQLDALGAPL